MCGVAAAYFIAETYYENQREALYPFQLFPALFLLHHISAKFFSQLKCQHCTGHFVKAWNKSETVYFT